MPIVVTFLPIETVLTFVFPFRAFAAIPTTFTVFFTVTLCPCAVTVVLMVMVSGIVTAVTLALAGAVNVAVIFALMVYFPVVSVTLVGYFAIVPVAFWTLNAGFVKAALV